MLACALSLAIDWGQTLSDQDRELTRLARAANGCLFGWTVAERGPGGKG